MKRREHTRRRSLYWAGVLMVLAILALRLARRPDRSDTGLERAPQATSVLADSPSRRSRVAAERQRPVPAEDERRVSMLQVVRAALGESAPRLTDPEYLRMKRESRAEVLRRATLVASELAFSSEETRKFLRIVEEQEDARSVIEDQVELTRGRPLAERMKVVGHGEGLPASVIARVKPAYRLSKIESELGARRLEQYRAYIHADSTD